MSIEKVKYSFLNELRDFWAMLNLLDKFAISILILSSFYVLLVVAYHFLFR